jgi:hypothetical protein
MNIVIVLKRLLPTIFLFFVLFGCDSPALGPGNDEGEADNDSIRQF